MLDDRFYMRRASFESQRSITVTLLIINAVVFVVESILEYYTPRLFLVFFSLFALSPSGLTHGFIWQLLTFQFLHASLMHLLINCLVIYVFGRALEDTLGRSNFLKLYLLSGVMGGLLQFIGQMLLASHFGRGPVVGASAGAFGLVAAYATMFPERPLTLLLAFIIPVSMRAKYLLAFSAALAIFGIIVPTDNVAHAAHLGGLIGGIGYIHWLVRRPSGWFQRRCSIVSNRVRELVGAPAGKRLRQQPQKPLEPEDLPPAEFISREVDPILDKISARGIHSLTARERQILEAARNKMAKK